MNLVGIIYLNSKKEEEYISLIKHLSETIEKFYGKYSPICVWYQPINYQIAPNLKIEYSKIEDPIKYKKRVTMDWGVEMVNDLEILKKEQRNKNRKKKKRKNGKKRNRQDN